MIAERVNRIELSSTLKITAKAKSMKEEGIDVIDFSVGEPDFPTLENIKEAAKRAIDSDFTKYTPADGIPKLKQAIIEKFKRDHNLEYELNEIIISCGAKHCLSNLSIALFDKGDEAIIPVPYWVSYPQQVKLAEAIPRFVQTKEKNDFKITPEELKSHIGVNTKALILNYPSNPTGAVYTKGELERIAEIVIKEGIYVIADEVYEKIIYDDFKFTSIASLGKEIKERTIIVNGVSKTYSMTGWRIGYAAGPKEIIQAMVKLQSHNTSNPSSISQMASLEALTGPQYEIPKMVAEFQRRRNYILYKLSTIPEVTCVKPQGAFYVFPNFSAYFNKSYHGVEIKNSYGLAYYLLKQAKVAVVPGDTFGLDSCIRISFATSMETIEEGMTRIIEALKKLKFTSQI
jgi:aspartate/methionine/tyrosine aminotransferase